MEHTHYKIGVITNSDGQSMQDLTAMAKQHNVTFDPLPFSHVPLNDLKTSDFVKTALKYDIIYYRTGMRDTVIDELAAILQKEGTPIINASTKHLSIHKKIQQALVSGIYNIPHPKSFMIRNFDYEVARELLGDTFVVKPDIGAKGTAVTLITSAEDLAELKENKKKNHYIYQEYISGADEYRVYTVGNKGIATYKKIAGDGEFRANLHTGGRMEKTEEKLEKRLLEFGGHVADCFGADISGVDVLVHNDELLLLELNWQPGWEQLDVLTGTNFSKETIQYILNRAHEQHSFTGKIKKLLHK